jgi:hypothetical protein
LQDAPGAFSLGFADGGIVACGAQLASDQALDAAASAVGSSRVADQIRLHIDSQN